MYLLQFGKFISRRTRSDGSQIFQSRQLERYDREKGMGIRDDAFLYCIPSLLWFDIMLFQMLLVAA